MDKQALINKIKAMAVAKTCRPELKRKAQKYLVALGKPGEKIAAENLIAEIEQDLTTIDELTTFARSARAIQILGKDGAKKLLAHVDKLHASGAEYCDCAACKPAAIILQNKEILLAATKPEENLPTKQTLLKKIREMAASQSCCPELKLEVQNYFQALGTPREKVAAETLIDEIKADVVPIELLIIHSHSNRAIETFGIEGAKKFAAHADALKASGAKYCNCLACTIGLEILEHKEILLV